jgi:hypothetical protein
MGRHGGHCGGRGVKPTPVAKKPALWQGWAKQLRSKIETFDVDRDGVLNAAQLRSFLWACMAPPTEAKYAPLLIFFTTNAANLSPSYVQHTSITVDGMCAVYHAMSVSAVHTDNILKNLAALGVLRPPQAMPCLPAGLVNSLASQSKSRQSVVQQRTEVHAAQMALDAQKYTGTSTGTGRRATAVTCSHPGCKLIHRYSDGYCHEHRGMWEKNNASEIERLRAASTAVREHESAKKTEAKAEGFLFSAIANYATGGAYGAAKIGMRLLSSGNADANQMASSVIDSITEGDEISMESLEAMIKSGVPESSGELMPYSSLLHLKAVMGKQATDGKPAAACSATQAKAALGKFFSAPDICALVAEKLTGDPDIASFKPKKCAKWLQFKLKKEFTDMGDELTDELTEEIMGEIQEAVEEILPETLEEAFGEELGAEATELFMDMAF